MQAGNGSDLAVTLAWVYVGLRVLHSVVQTTVNKVLIRFSLFTLSSLVLIALASPDVLALG